MGPLGYGLVGGRKWCWIAAQLSVLAALIIVYAVAHHGSVVIDFKGGFYDSGRAILTDHNPYHAGFLAHQAQVMRSGGVAIGENNASAFSVSLYPAPTILTLVPLSLLPFSVAAAIYTLLSVLALIAGLRLLGVRDNRCLMIAVGSWPFLFGVLLGAVGPWVVLGAGIAWRWRDRLWRPAVAIAGVVLLKLFPWPARGVAADHQHTVAGQDPHGDRNVDGRRDRTRDPFRPRGARGLLAAGSPARRRAAGVCAGDARRTDRHPNRVDARPRATRANRAYLAAAVADLVPATAISRPRRTCRIVRARRQPKRGVSGRGLASDRVNRRRGGLPIESQAQPSRQRKTRLGTPSRQTVRRRRSITEKCCHGWLGLTCSRRS
jgi:hypothetical protein